MTSLQATLRDAICEALGGRKPWGVRGETVLPNGTHRLTSAAEVAVKAWLGEDAQVEAAARAMSDPAIWTPEADEYPQLVWMRGQARREARAALGALTHHEPTE